ncbi:hypothetical protein LOK49_LG13G00879 [Camellia lanceoleosa]|uniref:Uncharacterized protein n=1 Tax=Camellia lanceoleosa TaxID=1840588 RepID=A0ACC0FIV5_9ERIC|nr:hypothetical protein LOK49_LG13G00879 [Camellia lanceoleosa]
MTKLCIPIFHHSSYPLYPTSDSSLKTNAYQHHPHIEHYQNSQEENKTMASTSAILAATPLTSATQKRFPSSAAFFKPLPVRPSKAAVVGSKTTIGKFEVKVSMKEKVVTGLTAAAMTASMVIPDVAEAAGSGVSPSLKNFLLSIVAGGVVLTVIVGLVVGVANFDPVKRG